MGELQTQVVNVVICGKLEVKSQVCIGLQQMISSEERTDAIMAEQGSSLVFERVMRRAGPAASLHC
jgi:hypothetical protein